ncbi:ribosome maturation factor RimM [Nitrogeniibacter mangrovi]|uniref:Ribosome maturation factor RimM n=1 Tax=Nitrogeniibacter mangrovi TaxID=2016596 RepID=A0A6C1B1Q9_9RHOO|nr:ribosome maturation factor RimM [Nitrogeniibacter mangrovi]QID17293.1 ribosome maturation factor RimM [Nitrogeniibacter mangrovi]
MIVMGRIIAPYGIKGWVKIHPFGDDPLSWKKMPRWWLCTDDRAPEARWEPRALKGLRQQGKSLVAAFEGIDDRTAAEALQGCYVAAPREAMPPTAKDEYYWADLIGLAVENAEGEALGTVTSLISAGAHEVLQVSDGDLEHLIPFVPAYVDTVDTDAGRIRVQWQKDWS